MPAQQQSQQPSTSLVTSLASVANNAKQVDLLILGGGRGGLAMLKVLQHYDWIHIHAIIDIDEQASAFTMARALGIQTSTDREFILKQFDGDIIIDVTGDHHMVKQLTTSMHTRNIELISGKSAKLLFDLVSEQLRNEKTIQSQSTKLNLLDSMLEITNQLENKPALSDITHQSLTDLHTHIEAVKGLAVIFNSKDCGQIVGTIGVEKPNQDPSQRIVEAVRGLNKQQRFKVLAKALSLHGPETTSAYNIIIPLWQHDHIMGALLFELPNTLSCEQTTMLNIAAAHLNMTVKTLDHYQRLESMAIHDGLTGVYNRRFFDHKLNKEVKRIQRSKHASLICAFIDVDNFKQINDSYGHQTGDIALKEIANSLSLSIREYDICARYGGDEFVVLLPAETQGKQGFFNTEQLALEKIGQRMLQYIAAIKIPQAPELKLSASIGIAIQSSAMLDAKKLLKHADNAVYQAKTAGKACFRIHLDQQQFQPTAATSAGDFI